MKLKKYNEDENEIPVSRFIFLLCLKLTIAGMFAFLFVVFFPILLRPFDIWELIGMTMSFIGSLAGLYDIINTIVYFMRKEGRNKPFFWQ